MHMKGGKWCPEMLHNGTIVVHRSLLAYATPLGNADLIRYIRLDSSKQLHNKELVRTILWDGDGTTFDYIQ